MVANVFHLQKNLENLLNRPLTDLYMRKYIKHLKYCRGVFMRDSLPKNRSNKNAVLTIWVMQKVLEHIGQHITKITIIMNTLIALETYNHHLRLPTT